MILQYAGYVIYSSDLCEAYNRTANFRGVVSNDLSFASVRTKFLVDATPVEKFVSQVVTLPATIRVFLPTTKGGREERPWERGWRIVC